MTYCTSGAVATDFGPVALQVTTSEEAYTTKDMGPQQFAEKYWNQITNHNAHQHTWASMVTQEQLAEIKQAYIEEVSASAAKLQVGSDIVEPYTMIWVDAMR